ncbi:MAG: MFS transporter [Candidatus Omnitrophota bacterium]|nr:MAG: MFS transporter [Candidatus Omnitrophota bacterium]
MDKKSFFVLCGLFFTLSFSVAATAALIPTIASFFGQPPLLAGKLVWIYMLPYGLFALIWGPLSRKFSIKRVLFTCLLFFSLTSALVGSASNITFAFAGRLGMGIFGSCFVPLSLIIIGKEAPRKNKSRYVGYLFSLSFLSSLLGIFLSGFLFWRTIYFIPSFLALLVFGVGSFFLKDFDYRGSFKISYHTTFKDKNVLKLFTFICIGSFLYHSIQQWLGVYLSKEYLFNQLLISSVFTISSLTAIFSESIGGVFASRFGAQNLASFGLLVMSIFVFSLLIFKIPKAVFFAVVFWGLGWAFNHVGLSSVLTHLPDKFLRDASSLNSSLRFFSGGLGAYCGGKAISLFNFHTHFLIVGCLIIVLGLALKRHMLVVEGGENG